LGDESYLRELCRRKISDAYVPEGVRDWGITRYSADDDSISTILSQAQTLPMLAPQQVIFVRDVDAWERLGDDSRDALVKQLSVYLENPAPFPCWCSKPRLDQRMRLAKMFAEKQWSSRSSFRMIHGASETCRPLALGNGAGSWE